MWHCVYTIPNWKLSRLNFAFINFWLKSVWRNTVLSPWPGLAIKMPAGFWTMKLNPSASAPSPASAPHWTVRPAIYLKFMRKKILTMECIKHSETSNFMCGSHAKKELSTDGLHRLLWQLFLVILFLKTEAVPPLKRQYRLTYPNIIYKVSTSKIPYQSSRPYSSRSSRASSTPSAYSESRR